MTRLVVPLAALALAGVVLALAVGALVPGRPLTSAEQAAQLAAELRCPDCQALSVADSHTVAAEAIRAEIAEQLAAGRGPDQIRASFVARYGEWILLQPQNPLIWALPALAVLGGIGVLGWWLRSRRPAPPARRPAAEAERQRVRDELEALDG